jgi:hypothetical protein
MIEMQIDVEKIVKLTLSEKEADWLKAVVQNPLYDRETVHDSEMREKFFNAISAALRQEGN